MMKCREFQKILSLYLAGELGEERRNACGEHVRSCDCCGLLYTETRELGALLRETRARAEERDEPSLEGLRRAADSPRSREAR